MIYFKSFNDDFYDLIKSLKYFCKIHNLILLERGRMVRMNMYSHV